ncbi:MAG: dTMP kinase [candidate division KSB1 bacterium]|nr:dTMP kinase [candidate division KSB1 bacterium]
MDKGLFISLEGIDFCGKTTQAHLLARRWSEVGREVVSVRDPGSTAISERLREILLDRSAREMHPMTELLLYEAARAQLVAQIIRPGLQRGAVVVADRFSDSTTAYQGYGRGLPLKEVEEANRLGSLGLCPDLTVVIDIPVEESQRRQQALGMPADRIEDQEADFRRRVREGYLEIARHNPQRVILIDGLGTPAEVHARIWEAMEHRLEETGKLSGAATT